MWQRFWAHVRRNAVVWAVAYLAVAAVIYLAFIDGIAIHWWLVSVAALLAPALYYELRVVPPEESVFARWRKGGGD